MILVAILLPPLAVLLCKKPVQALLNVLLTLCFWIPGIIHAIFVVQNYNAAKRHRETLAAMANRPQADAPQSPY